MNRKEILLCALAAGSGFIMMVYELVAARQLAPFVGSSTYVWTSVIGVIVAALSIGYWMGGRIADLRHRESDVALLFLATGVGIILSLIGFLPAIEWAMQRSTDVRLQAVIATSALYAPVSIVIGMISPYLAKLNVRTLEQSGQSVANLSMFNALGGIFGTFLTGFFLFNLIGIREIMVALAVMALILSWTMAPKVRLKKRVITSAVIIAVSGLAMLGRPAVTEIETASAHYIVTNGVASGVKSRMLITSPHGVQSAAALDGSNKLVFWYTQRMAEVIEREKPKARSILLLGGGTFTLPRYLAEKMPDAHIDVVEIDPKLVEIAREHFFYDDPKNVTPIAADARTFLNNNTKQYDIVLVDVYGGDAIPVTLMTDEYGALVRKATRAGGIVMLNSIAGDQGVCRELFDTTVAPYYSRFDHRYMLARDPGQDAPTNIMTIFSDRKLNLPGYIPIPPVSEEWLYTDNFVPADRLYATCDAKRQTH